MGGQDLICAPKFPPKLGIFSPNIFYFWTKIVDKNVFRQTKI